jgi:beta-glucosidase
MLDEKMADKKRTIFVGLIAAALGGCLFSFLSCRFGGEEPYKIFDYKKYPYFDANLPVEQRVSDLLGRMTLEEKVSQMTDEASAIERLGIPAYNWWSECLHGLMATDVTVFPQAIGLASTWNPELIFEITTAISDEARALNRKGTKDRRVGGLTYWSPTINIARDPRWGRTQETYGEDPYLTSRIAVAFVRGLQGNDPKFLKLVSTPKHFVANNLEYDRHSGSSNIDEQLLREYYLPAFKACVTEARAHSVMCAYNALNNIPCCTDHRLMTGILRDEWGFDGYVVSDCGAIEDVHADHKYLETAEQATAAAIKAGCDLNCGDTYKDYLVKAVEKDLVTQAQLNKNLKRLLKARFLLGMFDPPQIVPFNKIPLDVIDCPKHRQLALRAARESIVLLKNERNFLPLDKNRIKTIAVIGPNADVIETGNYTGTATKARSCLEGVKNKVGADVKVEFAKGCDVVSFVPIPTEYLIPKDANAGKTGLTGEYFDNKRLEGEPLMERIDENIDVNWGPEAPTEAFEPNNFSVRWSGKLIAPVTGLHQLYLTSQRGSRLYIDDKCVADRLHDWKMGTDIVELDMNKGQQYDIKVEYRASSSKKLPNSFVHLGWDVERTAQVEDDIDKAIELAKKADVVIAVLGINQQIEGESNDRFFIGLPAIQQNLIKKVFKDNPNTAVVLINGSPIAHKWLKDNVPAIVEAWYPGEEGGTAVADVLFGDYNPAGRLPMTFHNSIDELPPFDDYDIRKGRTYMYFPAEPLYCFGYGLSYTKFDYGNLQINPSKIEPDGKINISIDIKNTGPQDGDEVVQLYVQQLNPKQLRPSKQLKGFRRISVKKAQTQTIRFTLTAQDFATFDTTAGKFVTEPGQYEIQTGASSSDIKAKGTIEITERIQI